MTEPLRIELGWPVSALSPNARVHYMVLSRARKAARTEANWATRIVLRHDWAPAGDKVKVHLICHPPRGTVQPDADGMVSRVKSHLDGIQDALGINDSTFEAPTVEWADKTERGKLVVVLS